MRIAEGEGETETKRRRETEMMQQQMAAYASTTVSTELIQKVRSSSRCRPEDHLLPSCTALSLSLSLSCFQYCPMKIQSYFCPFSLYVWSSFCTSLETGLETHRETETRRDRDRDRDRQIPAEEIISAL